jgi:CubicO group peptidase (beta-lactamase class C family)
MVSTLRLTVAAALVLACRGEASPVGAVLAQDPSPSPFPYVVPESLGLATADLRSLVDTMEQWLRDGDIVGGELLIVKDRQIVWHEVVGWRDREREIPYERNTIGRIRSMTKPFVGTSVQVLAEEGTLRLADPVSGYLPSWDNDRSRHITIEQLLHHRGGFTQPGYPGPLRRYSSLREAVDATGRAGPQHEPGSRYFYSDAGSATLGAIVAQVSGMPVETFIETRILQPLEMGDTFTMLTMDDPRRPRVSSTYSRTDPDRRFEKYWENTAPQDMQFFRASGGMYSTPRDYAKFLALWMDLGAMGTGRLLQEETVIAALEGRPTGGSYEYGMQWQVFPQIGSAESGRPPFGHGGSDGTIAVADPAEDLMVLYFTQSRGGNTTRRMVELAWEVVGTAN